MKFLLSVRHTNGHFSIIARLTDESKERLMLRFNLRKYSGQDLFLMSISPDHDAIVRIEDETGIPEMTSSQQVKVAVGHLVNVDVRPT